MGAIFCNIKWIVKRFNSIVFADNNCRCSFRATRVYCLNDCIIAQLSMLLIIHNS